MSTNMTTDVAEPSAPPPGPQQGGAGSIGMTEPSRPPEQVGAAAAMATGLPTMQPPGQLAAAGGAEAGAVTATWQTGQVTGLWAINELRNAWIHANGAWRRIYNGRDWAFTALVTLASQARATGRTINYRQEADGMVYEIYLW